MNHHDLKIETPYFEAVLSGDKQFEIRYDDRGYQKGDTVTLNEIEPDYLTKTGRKVDAEITYVTSFAQKDNFVVFGIRLNSTQPIVKTASTEVKPVEGE